VIVRTLSRFGLFFAAFLLSFGMATAWAGFDKEGKVSFDNSVDGSSANVRGDDFGNIDNGTCVLYSVSVQDNGNLHQLEAGIVRCDGTTFSSCNTRGITYVERWYSNTNTSCDPGGTFSDGTPYFGSVFRDSNSSDTFHGSIGSAENFASGFSLSTDVVARTFAEATSGSSCPNNNPKGHFGYFSRFNYGPGWEIMQDPGHYTVHVGFGPCWSIENSNNNGAYDVD
jgi:hypothetical protein